MTPTSWSRDCSVAVAGNILCACWTITVTHSFLRWGICQRTIPVNWQITRASGYPVELQLCFSSYWNTVAAFQVVPYRHSMLMFAWSACETNWTWTYAYCQMRWICVTRRWIEHRVQAINASWNFKLLGGVWGALLVAWPMISATDSGQNRGGEVAVQGLSDKVKQLRHTVGTCSVKHFVLQNSEGWLNRVVCVIAPGWHFLTSI